MTLVVSALQDAGGYAILRQNNLELLILHLYAYGSDGRSLGRAGGRCTVTWLPNCLGWVDYFIFLPIVLRSRALRARAPLKLRYPRQCEKELWSLQANGNVTKLSPSQRSFI